MAVVLFSRERTGRDRTKETEKETGIHYVLMGLGYIKYFFRRKYGRAMAQFGPNIAPPVGGTLFRSHTNKRTNCFIQPTPLF
jgi:hypothetical protein